MQLPDLAAVQLIDDVVIERLGGLPGLLDANALHGAVHRPSAGFGRVELFPTLFLKAAALAHGLATDHPFADGNKRTALLAAVLTLRLNGLRLIASGPEAEEAVVGLVDRSMDLGDFARWLEAHSAP